MIPFEYLNLHSHAPVCVSIFRAYPLLHAGYISDEADCFGVFFTMDNSRGEWFQFASAIHFLDSG